MNTFRSIGSSKLLLLALCALPASLQAAPAQPAKPSLSWQETNLTLNNGSVNVPISWNMWWGTNGNQWQLSQNGVVVHTAALTANGQNAQSGNKSVAVTAAGTYDYIVSLCNVVGTERSCTASDKRTIKVTGSGGPGTPGGFDPWTQLNFAGWPSQCSSKTCLIRTPATKWLVVILSNGASMVAITMLMIFRQKI